MRITIAQASRSLFWSSVDTFSQTGFSIVSLILLAHWLSVTAIGLGSLAVMLTQLLTMPFELAFHDALVQRQELKPQHAASALTVTLIGALLGGILLVIGAPQLALLYGKPELAPLLQVTAIAIPFGGVSAIIAALLRRELSFAPLARRTVVGRMVGIGLGLVAAWHGAGAWALVTMYVSAIVLSTLVLLFDWRRVPALRCSAGALRELFDFAAPNMLSQFLLLANGKAFVALAGIYLDAAALGSFSLAFRLIEELRNTLSSAAAQLALPLLSRRARQPQQFAAVYGEASSFTASILLPLYAGFVVTAGDLMPALFGLKWQAAVPVMQWLAMAAFVVTLRQYSSIALNALGRPIINAWLNGVAFAASIALLVGGAVTSAQSAATVWLIRAVLLWWVSLWGLRYGAKFPLTTQLMPILAPALASLLMAIGVLVVQHVLLFERGTTLRLAISVVSGMLVYGVTFQWIAPSLLSRVINFAASALRRQPSTELRI